MKRFLYLFTALFTSFFAILLTTVTVQASVPAASWVQNIAIAGRPNGMAIDSSGNIYVTDYDNHRVYKYNGTGTLLGQFGTYGTGNGQLNRPEGIAVDSSGNIYVTQTGDPYKVQKFNSSFTWLLTITGEANGGEDFSLPQDVVVNSSGQVFVMDSWNYQVQVFNSTDGSFIRKFGTRSDSPQGFGWPTGIALDGSGNLVISDISRRKILRYTPEGAFLSTFGSAGTLAGQFGQPKRVFVDNTGKIWVADSSSNRIQPFTSTYQPLTPFGTAGSGNGQFSNPSGVVVNSSGEIFVADRSNYRIQKFNFTATDYQLSSIAAGVNIINSTTYLNVESTALTGVNNAAASLRLQNEQGITISDITVNMTADRNWSTVNAGADQATGRSFVSNLIGAPGAAATHTLYIPVPEGRTSESVFICPNATSLAEVTDSCAGGVERTAGSYVESFGNITVGTTTSLGDGIAYWTISGITGSGGIAYDLLEFSGSGSGTAFDPYVITTCSELQEMKDNRDADYVLANDIDCSDTINWNAGQGFQTVGTYPANPFTGSLDGASYTISGLYESRPSYNGDLEEDAMGLFGYAIGASFTNINLENVTMNGVFYVGALVGHMTDSIVDNCTSSGNLGQGEEWAWAGYFGGLIGSSFGASEITNSSSSVNITYGGDPYYMGGFIGQAEGTTILTNDHATGSIVVGYDPYQIGGFVGYIGELYGTDVTIDNCSATGNIHTAAGSGYGDEALGGDGYWIGGFAGWVGGNDDYSGADITNSYATGNILAEGNDNYWYGGFIGWLLGPSTISNSYATGSIDAMGDDNYWMGGFGGQLGGNSTIVNTYATGDLFGGPYTNGFGGYAGWIQAGDHSYVGDIDISYSYSTGDIAVLEESYGIGGFVGWMGYAHTSPIQSEEITISYCYSTGNITAGVVGKEAAWGGSMGGFVGFNENASVLTQKIEHSFTTTKIDTIGMVDDVGGFIGFVEGNITIDQCASLGEYVEGSMYVGGFVGDSYYSTGWWGDSSGYLKLYKDSYTRTNVSSSYVDIVTPTENYMGGFISYQISENDGADSVVENSYATGSISMLTNPATNIDTTIAAPMDDETTVMTVTDATGIVPGTYLLLDEYEGTPYSTTLASPVAIGAEYVTVVDASGLSATWPYNQVIFEKGVEGKEDGPYQVWSINVNTLRFYSGSYNRPAIAHDVGTTVTYEPWDMREVVYVSQVNGNNLTISREMAYTNSQSHEIGDTVRSMVLPDPEDMLIGGFASFNSGTITDSYWNTETSGFATSVGGEGLTTSEMHDVANYNNWDFDTTNVWNMNEQVNDNYPYLDFDDPTLSALEPSVGDLEPAFNRNIFEYTLTVPLDATNISFTPTFFQSNPYLIRSSDVNGTPISNGVSTGDISLPDPSTEIDFNLESLSWRTATYTITVVKGDLPTPTPTPSPTPTDTPWNGSCDYCWTRTWGGSGDDNAWSINLDSVGNKYITGQFADTVNFNTTGAGASDIKTSNGSYDVYLTKFNSDGSYAWTRTMGGTGDDRGYFVHLDKDNNIYLTGFYSSPDMNFNLTGVGGNDVHSTNGDADIFITKINADGSYGWSRTMGDDTDRDVGLWLDSDSQGRIYLTGYFGFNGVDPAVVEFNTTGSGPSDLKTSIGHGDAYISSFNADGSYRFTRAYGSFNADSAYGMSLDNSDNLYVAGAFMDNDVNFNQSGSGPDDLRSSAGCSDFYLTKYNADGTYAWTYTMGGIGCDYAYGMKIDSSGNIYIVGYFTSSDLDFNGSGSGSSDLRSSAGSGDIYLTKYTNTGSYAWTRTMGGVNFDWGRNLTLDNAGHIIITGQFASPNVNFNTTGSGAPEYKSSSATDVFTTKFTTSGAYVWTKTLGNTGLDFGMGIASDQDSSIYITGQFQGTDTNFNKDGSGPSDLRSSNGAGDAFMTKYTDGDDSGWCSVPPTLTPTPRPTTPPRRPTLTPTPVCVFEIDGQCINELEIINVRTTIDGNSASICWETNVPSASFLNYSPLGGDLELTTSLIQGGSVFCQQLDDLLYDQEYSFRINAEADTLTAIHDDTFRTGILDEQGYSCSIYADPLSAKLDGNSLTMNFTTDNTDSCSMTWGIVQSSLDERADVSRSGQRYSSYLMFEDPTPTTIYYRIACSAGSNQCTNSNRIALASGAAVPGLDFFGMDLNFGPFEFIALTGLALTITPISIAFPQFWLYGIAWIFPKKKQRPWGIVYDANTKNPIAFAVVRLFDQGGNMLKQVVTDLQGRFSFLADPGTYQLSVEHSDYNKVFKNMSILKDDSKIAENIGLVALEENRPLLASLRSSMGTFFMKTYWILGFLGMIFSFVAMVSNFEIINLMIFIVYVVQMVMMLVLRPKRDFGYVYNTITGERIKGAFIQVQDVTQGRQVDVQMSDERGRFGFNLDQGEYLLIVKVGDKSPKTSDLQSIQLANGSMGYKYDSSMKGFSFGF